METVNKKVTTKKNDIQYGVFNGPVELRSGSSSKKCHLHLYRKFLVVTNSRYKITFKIKYVIPLTALWMGECAITDFVDTTLARKSILLGWPMKNFMVTFSSEAQKKEWCTLLQRSINEHMKKDHGKGIALELLTEDIPSWNTSFTVTAARLDTVNDIIKKLRPLLGIPNTEEDYQLCFSSSKEEVPYPLQGVPVVDPANTYILSGCGLLHTIRSLHVTISGPENPYAIRMSDLWNSAFLAVGPKDCRDYLDVNKVIQELHSPHVPGVFILKPKNPSKDKSCSKKTVRKRSFINWIFRRNPDYVRLDTTAPNPGHVFGKTLMDFC